jgi:hypothetical protein
MQLDSIVPTHNDRDAEAGAIVSPHFVSDMHKLLYNLFSLLLTCLPSTCTSTLAA